MSPPELQSDAVDPDDVPMLPSKIHLIDRSVRLVAEWKTAFAGASGIEAIAGDYFQKPADAMVSPANSFGIMDGGLDLVIRNELGHIVQKRTQDAIVEKYHGELPVGCAAIIATNDTRWRYMIAAPTMRVPESVAFSFNAYLAFRAILVAIENVNKQKGKREIDSVVCCGLATGIGKMDETKCARQMRIAHKTMLVPSMIRSFDTIRDLHRALQPA